MSTWSLWVPKVKVIHWPWSKFLSLIILNFFFSITTRPIETKFHVVPPWDRGTKACSNGPNHMTKMAAMPYIVNTFQIFFSGTERPMSLKLGMQHRVFEDYQVCSNDVHVLTLTYFTARSNLVPYAFVREKVKTVDLFFFFFSETIVVYDIKVGRCSQLNEYMKLWVPKVRVIRWPCSKSLRFNIFKLLFLNNHWF